MKSPAEYIGDIGQTLNPTLNTSGWTTNSTTAFRIGNLVFVNVYVLGTPTERKIIASGLPKPNRNNALSFIIPSSLGNSVGAVSLAGDIVLSSPGTTSAGYFGATVIYETKD